MSDIDPNGIKVTGATMSGMGIVERTWDWIAYDVLQRVPAVRRLRAAAHSRALREE